MRVYSAGAERLLGCFCPIARVKSRRDQGPLAMQDLWTMVSFS